MSPAELHAPPTRVIASGIGLRFGLAVVSGVEGLSGIIKHQSGVACSHEDRGDEQTTDETVLSTNQSTMGVLISRHRGSRTCKAFTD